MIPLYLKKNCNFEIGLLLLFWLVPFGWLETLKSLLFTRQLGSCCEFQINMEKDFYTFEVFNIPLCYQISIKCQFSTLFCYSYKGPSINDVSSEGEGGGYQKLDFGAIFRAKTGATGGGRGVQKSKIRGDVVYGCSLSIFSLILFLQEFSTTLIYQIKQFSTMFVYYVC